MLLREPTVARLGRSTGRVVVDVDRRRRRDDTTT